MKKVLVLEDEANIRSFVVINLKRAGYEAIEAETGEEALAQLKRNPDIKVALLDIMLPDMDGFEVCRRIRAGDNNIGIIMLTARTQEMDKVTGLMTGADDYVTKPFSLAVLLAKTEALIRRSRGGGAETLACGAITLEPGRRACTVGGRPVALPPREYELLLCLMRNKGQVLRREQLLDKVWGIDFEGGDRAVDGRIKVLRAALGPAGKQIRTVFKVGYKLEEGAHG